jgi:hypothetical protein
LCTCTSLKLGFLGPSLYFFVPTYGLEILLKSLLGSDGVCYGKFATFYKINYVSDNQLRFVLASYVPAH